MPFFRSLILMPVLAVCLLSTLVPPPALGQSSAGQGEILSPVGDFPAIDGDGQGGFVSVWVETLDSSEEILGSLIPPGGASPGTPFQVNTRVTGPQVAPSVAAGPQGDFMVVWQGGTSEDPTGGDGNHEGVFGQAFSRTGDRLGPQRRLSERTTDPQVTPRVAALEDGSFVAIWQDQSTERFEIVARLFSATGAPLGPELRLPVAGERNHNHQVASYRKGFAVSWTEEPECSDNHPASGRAVIARFDPSGRRTGKLIRMGRLACGETTVIEALAGSRAGAVAILRTQAGHAVQRFGPSGEILGKPDLITRRLCGGAGLGTFCRYVNDVALNDQGLLAVVWQVAADPTIFYARVYRPDLHSTNGIELGFGGSGSNPAIALANDGTVAATLFQDWEPEHTGLILRRFRARR